MLGTLACVDPRSWSNRRAVLRQAGLLMLALAPLALWFDYIHSIYGSLIFTSGETLARLVGLLWRAQMVVREATSGSADHALRSASLVIAFVTQLVTVAARPRLVAAWWRIGVAYAALLLFLGRPLWDGTPPAVVRIELPLLAAFNVLLLRIEDDRWFWLLFVCGKLAALRPQSWACRERERPRPSTSWPWWWLVVRTGCGRRASCRTPDNSGPVSTIELARTLDGAEMQPSAAAFSRTLVVLAGRDSVAIVAPAGQSRGHGPEAAASRRVRRAGRRSPQLRRRHRVGLRFSVGISDERTSEELSRAVVPASDPASPRWTPIGIDLGDYGGRD